MYDLTYARTYNQRRSEALTNWDSITRINRRSAIVGGVFIPPPIIPEPLYGYEAWASDEYIGFIPTEDRIEAIASCGATRLRKRVCTW